ncbi:MAG: hypothetical protein ABIL05_00710 [candidate division WOR-3 bacterium]
MEELIGLLKSQAKISSDLLKKIEDYQKFKAEPIANAFKLENLSGAIKKLGEELPESKTQTLLNKWLEEELHQIARYKDDFRLNFSRDLKELLVRQGRELKGQLPILRCGFWTIKTDFEIGQATIFWGPEIEKLKTRIILNPGEIAQSIEDLDKDLKKKSIAGKDLLELVFRAYEHHLAVQRLARGEKILLIELLNDLVFLIQPQEFKNDPRREKFKEYSRVNFSYDLFLLRKTNLDLSLHGLKLRLTVATFDATLDKRRALWIPDNESGEGTYYSYISFS